MRKTSLKKLQKAFDKQMKTFISVNSRPIIVNLPPVKVDCPNCIHDSLFNQTESANRYNTSFILPVRVFLGTEVEEIIYPKPFNIPVLPSGVVFDPSDANPKILNTSICPVCNGRGELYFDREVCIDGNFNWHPSNGMTNGKIKDFSAGRLPDNIGIVKTELCNESICREAKSFIIDGVECEMIVPPTPKGVGEDHFIEFYVQKTDSTDNLSDKRKPDKRVLVSQTGQNSPQAASGSVPPPNELSAEDW